MIQHRLFPKGEYCHALISSPSNPNILIPVRGLIYDVKMDEFNPQYQIKIIKFYDDINFLKRYLFGYKFPGDFGSKSTMFNFKRKDYSTCEEFESRIRDGKNWERYLVVADSVMCTKTEAEIKELFNKVQTFIIEKHLKEVFEHVNRSYYRSGQYYFQTKDEFVIALKKFLKDREPNRKNWVDSIINRATFDELDGID